MTLLEPRPSTVLAAARDANDVGLCVIRAATDGTKKPLGRWEHWQSTRTTRDDIDNWFGGGWAGMGVVCGKVSGGLEMFELEGRAIVEGIGDAFDLAMADAGLDDLWDRIVGGYMERTPSGGFHVLYRCPQVDGSLELARRPATPEELDENPKHRVRVLIETRGEGGFSILAPSNGTTHPTGGAWQLEEGGFDTIATITPEERRALFGVARTFDQMPEEEPATPPRAPAKSTSSSDDTRPGDEFDAAHTCGDVLLDAGFVEHHQAGGDVHYTRPGKSTSRGSSATVWANNGRATLFSSSIDAPGEYIGKRNLTPWQLHVALAHNGDHSAAASAWRARHPRAPRVGNLLASAPGDTAAQADDPGADEPDDDQDVDDSHATWAEVDLSAALRGDKARAHPTILPRSDGRHLFYEGQINYLHGADGVGKSFVALFAAVDILTTGGHVVWADWEDPDETTIVARLLDLGVAPDVIAAQFHYIHPETEATPTAVAMVCEVIRRHGARLVVLDSVGEALGVDGRNEDKDNEVTPWFRLVLRPMAATGAAVLPIDHGVKNGDNPLHPSGSKRKRAMVTGSHFLVEAPRPISQEYHGGQLRLTTAKDRHGNYTRGKPAAVIDVAIYPDGGWTHHVHPPELAADDGAKNDRALARAVIRLVAELTEETGSAPSMNLIERSKRVKASAGARRAAVEYGVAMGALREEPGPHNARLFVHLKDLD